MLFKRQIAPLMLGLCCLFSVEPSSACSSTAILANTYQQAIRLFERGDYAAALVLFEQVYAQDPTCLGAQMDIAVTLFRLRQWDQARAVFQAILATPGVATGIRQQCEGFIRIIDEQKAIPAAVSANADTLPALQLALGVGVSDNINNGLRFEQLSIGQSDAPLTLQLGEKSKAQAGSWHDVEIAVNRALPKLEKLEAQGQLSASWRDSHQDDSLDLLVVRGMVEMKPGDWLSQVEPRLVISGGSVILDGEDYRQDAAIATQIQLPAPRNTEKIALSYQLTNSHYTSDKVAENDSLSHRLGVGIPLPSPVENVSLNADISHQWVADAERLADYQESSLRLRARYQPPQRHYTLSASYRISQQQDATIYNPTAFPEKYRDPTQQILNVGWAWQIQPDLTWEARLQARQQDSTIPLFENSALDLTTGMRWQLD